MKVKIMFFALLVGVLVGSCKRDNDDTPVPQSPQNEVLKDFTLAETNVTMKRGEVYTIDITSGNGEYQTNQSTSRAYAIVNIVNNKVQINALQTSGVSVKTQIIDVKSKKQVEITINIE